MQGGPEPSVERELDELADAWTSKARSAAACTFWFRDQEGPEGAASWAGWPGMRSPEWRQGMAHGHAASSSAALLSAPLLRPSHHDVEGNKRCCRGTRSWAV